MNTIKIDGRPFAANSKVINLPGGVSVHPSELGSLPPAQLVAPGVVAFTLVHDGTEYSAEAPQGVFRKIGSARAKPNRQFTGYDAPAKSCCGGS